MNSTMIGSHFLLMIGTRAYRRDWWIGKKRGFYKRLLRLIEGPTLRERFVRHARNKAYPLYDDRHRRL